MLPPCVNASEVDFWPSRSRDAETLGAIRYSLAALEEHRRAGRRDASSPSASANGPFKDLADFAGRSTPRR